MEKRKLVTVSEIDEYRQIFSDRVGQQVEAGYFYEAECYGFYTDRMVGGYAIYHGSRLRGLAVLPPAIRNQLAATYDLSSLFEINGLWFDSDQPSYINSARFWISLCDDIRSAGKEQLLIFFNSDDLSLRKWYSFTSPELLYCGPPAIQTHKSVTVMTQKASAFDYRNFRKQRLSKRKDLLTGNRI